MSTMDSVVRLITSVNVDEEFSDDRRMSVSARHEAELASGHRVLLLDDRGWTVSGPPGIWAYTTVEEIAQTARTVVGPDEPFDELSPADMDAGHWTGMVRRLGQSQVAADAPQLRRLPHDVVVSDRLLRRLGDRPGNSDRL